MNQYSTLKRRPVLFPASAAEFQRSVFSLKEEIKALIADNPESRAYYTQAALEVAIDLQSALADWKLTKVVGDKERIAASEELLAFASAEGAESASVDAAKAEIASIAHSSMKKMCDLYREGQINTVWGHDYASGLDHSLRRGARWVTSNPCKIQAFKKDFPAYYASLLKEIKRENPGAAPSVLAAQVFTKVCAISARALQPIYEETNREYGFVCMQVDPREIRNTQAMIDQVHFWHRAMAKELNMDEPNVVFKLPAVEAALPAVKVLLEENYKLCMTLNFSITQHMAFAELLSKGANSEYLVLMAGQLDDKIADELAGLGYKDAKVIARHGSEAVMRKSYRMLAEKGYKNLSIMSAAVRGPWHIQNSMAPVDGATFLITTVTGKVEEFDANPTPIASVIDQPTEERYLEALRKSKVFQQAYSDPKEGLLPWEALFSFPPFVGFYNNFTAAYQEIEDDFR
jgi:transaldolase